MTTPKAEAKPAPQPPSAKLEQLLAAMRQQQQMYGRR